MDEILAARYQALFDRYTVSGASYQIKIFLRSWIQNHPDHFRPDAMYFLLVNFDQMIIHPHAGDVEDSAGNLLELYEDPTDLVPKIEEAASIILTPLLSETAPVSAHRVLQSINENWESLQALFRGWG